MINLKRVGLMLNIQLMFVIMLIAVGMCEAKKLDSGDYSFFEFENQSQIDAWNSIGNATTKWVDSPWSDSGKAMAITFEKYVPGRNRWPAIVIKGRSHWPSDDNGESELYRELSFKIKNIGKDTANIYLHFRGNNSRYTDNHIILKPNEDRKVVIDLKPLAAVIPLSKIMELHIATSEPEQTWQVVVDDFVLSYGFDLTVSDIRKLIKIEAGNAKKYFSDPQYEKLFLEKIVNLEQSLGEVLKLKNITPNEVKSAQLRLDDIADKVQLAAYDIRGIVSYDRLKKSTFLTEKNEKSAWTIGTIDSMSKVMRNIVPDGMKFGQSCCFDVGLGESASQQVVIIPLTSDLDNIEWIAEDLIGPGGAKLDLQVRVVGYVKTAKPSGYEVKHVGWWPDPLIDYLKSFDLAVGQLGPLWLSIRTNESTVVGTYRGKLIVNVKNQSSKSVQIEVKVRPIKLPKTPTFRTALNYNEDYVRKLYGDKFTPELKWKYREFILQHRFNVDDIYRFQLCKYSVEDLKRLKKLGQNHITLANIYNTWVAKDKKMIDRISGFYERAKDAGFEGQCAIYGLDELPNKLLPSAIESCKALHKAFPDVPQMTTAFVKDFGVGTEVENAFDIWVPSWHSYDQQQDAIKNIRKKGKEVWWYTCLSGGLLIEYSGTEPRARMGVMNWKYQPDGFLYYSLIRGGQGTLMTDGPMMSWNPATYEDYK